MNDSITCWLYFSCIRRFYFKILHSWFPIKILEKNYNFSPFFLFCFLIIESLLLIKPSILTSFLCSVKSSFQLCMVGPVAESVRCCDSHRKFEISRTGLTPCQKKNCFSNELVTDWGQTFCDWDGRNRHIITRHQRFVQNNCLAKKLPKYQPISFHEAWIIYVMVYKYNSHSELLKR